MMTNIFRKIIENESKIILDGRSGKGYQKKYISAVQNLLKSPDNLRETPNLTRKCLICERNQASDAEYLWCKCCETDIENLRMGFALQAEKKEKFLTCKTCIELYKESKKLVLTEILMSKKFNWAAKTLQRIMNHLKSAHSQLFDFKNIHDDVFIVHI